MKKDLKKKKKSRSPLSKEEYLKAFVSELREAENKHNYKLIRKISDDVLKEKITPEQAKETFLIQNKNIMEDAAKKLRK